MTTQRERTAAHNVFAAFDHMDRAREAIAALERTGIEGAEISLLGKQVERAAGREDTTPRDTRVLRRFGRRAAIGMMIGAMAGGVIGLAAGMIVFGETGIWASTISGIAAGGLFGGVVGGMSTARMTESWELTFERRKGETVVAVQSDDADVIELAEKTLRDTEALRVERVDRRGERIE